MPELAIQPTPNTLAAHAAAQPVFATDPLMDDLHRHLAKQPQADIPLRHDFYPGLYMRTAWAAAGTLVISKIHKTRHPYVITKGRAKVFSETEGVIEVVAPFQGVTEPGTRRLIYVVEDIQWTTYHATEETDLAKIEALIIQPHDPSLMEAEAAAVALMTEGASS